MTVLANEVVAVLCKIAPDVDPTAVDHDRPLADQLDLDSMDYQNLLAALGTRYEVDFREADIPTLRSVNDLVDYVESHRARAR